MGEKMPDISKNVGHLGLGADWDLSRASQVES
jgi:hypothetical protein